ncbi:MAG: hypothetical protein U0269_35910 [Polyangiales bacterium]
MKRAPSQLRAACLIVCASCSTAPSAPIAQDSAGDALDATGTEPDVAMDSAIDRAESAAPFDRDVVERDRADVASAPRCYGVRSQPALLEHVASIDRESWALSNGAAGCVGDVDGDGRREFILLRMNEPSELIGGDFCSRGRVLLPELARGCAIADVDGAPGDELIVTTSAGWTRESAIYVGRVRAATAADRTIERFVFEREALLDERRPISPLGAPHAIVTDLDNDGAKEIAVSGNFPASFARVWERDAARWSTRLDVDLRTVMDESHGWLHGDVDGDGDDEALLLSNCGYEDRYVIRRFDQWAGAMSPDLAFAGPVHGTLADLDGLAPRELVTFERLACGSGGASSAHTLRAWRWSAADRRFVTIASLATARPTNDLVYVAAMDIDGDRAHEIIRCSSPLGANNNPRTCRAYALRGEPAAFVALPSAAAPFVWTSPLRRAILASVLVDDLDGDGTSELFLMGQDHVDVLRGARR